MRIHTTRTTPRPCTNRKQAFFDDAARDDHSAKLFGHVTLPQFRQVGHVGCVPYA